MKITVLTLFPEIFSAVLDTSILKRAQEQNLVTFALINLRDFAVDKYGTVDEPPFGGGAGMVMRPEPFFEAVDEVKREAINPPYTILMTPQGHTFQQNNAARLSQHQHLLFLCGHYEGVDERVRTLAEEEISLGDFVLTGGEIPALAVIDAVVRLRPGVLGNADATKEESFTLKNDTGQPLLEYPQYTRPREYRGMSVPEVLLSGHHENIEKWRREESNKRTKTRRPDLSK